MDESGIRPTTAPSRRDLTASPRLFRSPLLDKLSRVHPATPAILYLPAVGVLLGFSAVRLSIPPILLGLFFGYIVWTLFEYAMHRHVFHLVPPGALGARLHFLIHGVHHDHPSDPLRLVMPPLVSIPVALAVFALLRFVGGATLSLPVAAGFILGYVAYDTLHYHLHHNRPWGRLDAALRRRHMAHHFQDARRGFGISCPWWDDFFGTGPPAPRAG